MDIPYITAVLAGGTLRNEFLGTVGCKIQVGAVDLVATQLGRYIHPSTPGANHDVRLQDTYGTLLGQVTINTTGAPVGSFYYGTLAAAVTLSAGVNYYLMCTEDGGGDEWQSIDCNVTTTIAATIMVGAYSVGHAVQAPTEYPAGGAHTYGPYNFQYAAPVVVDSNARNKRASCLGLDALYRVILPVPDGTISQKDRYQLSGKYHPLEVIAAAAMLFRNRTGERFRISPSFPC